MPLPAAAVAVLASPWFWRAAGLAVSAAGLAQAARRARWTEFRADAHETAFDQVDPGLALHASRDAGRARADARAAWRGVLRLGETGPGLAIDAAALARLRLAPLPALKGPFRR